MKKICCNISLFVLHIASNNVDIDIICVILWMEEYYIPVFQDNWRVKEETQALEKV